MIRSVKDFLNDYKYLSEGTIKIMRALTDESLNQKVYSEGRTLGFLAWHITSTIPEMFSKAGLPFNYEEDSPVPATASSIVSEYEKLSGKVAKIISQEWSDSMLDDDLNMYGQVWKRGDMLQGFMVHEIHHRGQMTVLMRQAGLKVPGVYGPAKEEWASYGMPEQK